MGVIPDMAPDGVSFMTLAQKVQADLAEAGITVNIEPQEVAVYLEGYRDGKQQSVMCQWGPDYNDSNNQLAFLPGNTVGLRLGWAAEMDPELAELGQKASVETDSDKRAELFTEIQKQMDEKNAPAVVLLQPGKTWAVSSRLKNLTVSAAHRHNRAVLPPQMGSRLFHSEEAARKGLLPLLHPEIRKESPLAVSASRCRSLGFCNPTI